jgi:hypothetical protein
MDAAEAGQALSSPAELARWVEIHHGDHPEWVAELRALLPREEGRPMPASHGRAQAVLDDYLRRTGLSRPADAAQQYQVSLLRQWADHLDAVLEAEGIPPGAADRIIRGVIWGSTPQVAEAGIREELVTEMRQQLESRGVPRW